MPLPLFRKGEIMTIKKIQHGSPEDRGSADCYYQRQFNPHYWPDGTGKGVCVTNLTQEELAAYTEGWDNQESTKNYKLW